MIMQCKMKSRDKIIMVAMLTIAATIGLFHFFSTLKYYW